MNLIEMEGFLRGKCLPGDIKTGESNAEYLVRKFSELHEQLSESQREFRSADITMQNLEAQLKQSKIDADCYKKGMEASNARLVQLAAENAALKSKAAELVHEASEVYSAYNSSITEHDGDFMDMQTLQEMQCVETPATDAFLAEVRAQGVEEFLRGSQLPYQIATVLADYDNVDDATLQTVIWSGQPPEPDGDVWHLEYVSRGNAIVHAVLKELRKGVQSWAS
ncbi:hypothetical protein ABME00_13990 [Citrobacter amalonaticus]